MLKGCLERRLIGEVLVERALITKAQLERALEVQRSSAKEHIGQILVKLGFVAEIDIVIALVVQYNLPYIAVNKYDVAQEVLKLIPADVAWRDRLVPLDRIGHILSVVMLNPLNETTRAEIEKLTGCRIAVFISTKTDIDAALTRFYGEER